jgi:hypothetical protein
LSSIQKPTRGGRQSFLSWVDTGERLVARILALITGVVIISALLKLVLSLSSKLLTGSEATWLGDDLIKVLGDLLTVLIALEVLQNITSYLRRHVVQIELYSKAHSRRTTIFFELGRHWGTPRGEDSRPDHRCRNHFSAAETRSVA